MKRRSRSRSRSDSRGKRYDRKDRDSRDNYDRSRYDRRDKDRERDREGRSRNSRDRFDRKSRSNDRSRNRFGESSNHSDNKYPPSKNEFQSSNNLNRTNETSYPSKNSVSFNNQVKVASNPSIVSNNNNNNNQPNNSFVVETVVLKEVPTPIPPQEENEEDDIDLDALIDDLDDDFETKKRKEEEKIAQLALERQKRLDDIKAKYSQSNSSTTVPDITPLKTTEQEIIEESILSKHNNKAMEEQYEMEIANEPKLEVTNQEDEENDEGNRLARERIALEEEQNAHTLNKVTYDMFSDSPSNFDKNNLLFKGKKAMRQALADGNGNNPHLQSNWDDGEGYYKATIGEVIGERFRTLGIVGKGVFSTVLKCIDLQYISEEDQDYDNEKEKQIQLQRYTVAMKMIRNNDTMRKAAEKEKQILLQLSEKDIENKRFCVRFITHLEYRHHTVLVFEYLQMNLREALKKFGKDVGINISAVRIYARQLFVALRYLSELQIVHADIKLDNILCSADLRQVKLCDFGSAFYETDNDNDPTPYLVSRFYRAPEIILGLVYDRSIDMWSVCTSLYELFTGHVMFPGRNNNDMLRLIMAMKGKFPKQMLRLHLRAYELLQLPSHFDSDHRFCQQEMDIMSGRESIKYVDINNPTIDWTTVIRSSKAGADDMKLVNQLIDLLDKGLNLDPSKRLTPLEALKHPFFSIK